MRLNTANLIPPASCFPSRCTERGLRGEVDYLQRRVKPLSPLTPLKRQLIIAVWNAPAALAQRLVSLIQSTCPRHIGGLLRPRKESEARYASQNYGSCQSPLFVQSRSVLLAFSESVLVCHSVASSSKCGQGNGTSPLLPEAGFPSPCTPSALRPLRLEEGLCLKNAIRRQNLANLRKISSPVGEDQGEGERQTCAQ